MDNTIMCRQNKGKQNKPMDLGNSGSIHDRREGRSNGKRKRFEGKRKKEFFIRYRDLLLYPYQKTWTK
jgi:hypothetical protein